MRFFHSTVLLALAFLVPGTSLANTFVFDHLLEDTGSLTPTEGSLETIIGLGEIAAIDFITVSMTIFKTHHEFVVLALNRRRVVHFNVTTSPIVALPPRHLRLMFSGIPDEYLC